MTARDNCFFAIDQEVHAEWRRNNHGLELALFSFQKILTHKVKEHVWIHA